MRLSHVRLALIFKLLIRPKVRDEHLVCLFKGSVETIFTTDYSFVDFHIHSVSVLGIRFHI